MSAFDHDARVLAELDVTVAPRIEFVDALRERLLTELVGRADAPAQPRPRARTTLRRRLTRRRVLVVAIAIGLLLAGLATATLLDVGPWTSSEPRGAQVRAGFRLSPVYRAPENAFMDNYNAQALSPDGRDLFLARNRQDGLTELSRIHGVDGSRPVARRVVYFQSLNEPVLDNGPVWNGLTAGANGDVFALGATHGGEMPLDATIVVIHPDGTHQTVATFDDLARSARLPHGLSDFTDFGGFSIAATGSGRLWLRASILRRQVRSWPYDITNALVEIVDPNDDGDWSDRIVRRISLPRSVPGFRGRPRSVWAYYQPLVAEPSTPGDDRSRSVLLQTSGLVGYGTANPRGEYRVYRISDLNDDGDALDRGEVVLLYRGTATSPVLAERVNTVGGRRRRELVLGGVRRPDRLTLVPEHGRPVDIARSFPVYGGFTSVFAGPAGDVYPVYAYDEADLGSQLRVDRLAPTRAARPPAEEPRPASVQLPTGQGPTIALTTGGSTSSTATRWIRPDGSVAAHARGVGDVCQGRDGTLVFRSDAAVPREPYVYVAAPGEAPRELSDRAATPACPFDGSNVILARRGDLPDGPAWTLVRSDAATGRERLLVGYTPRFAMSPDGRRIVYVVRAHGRESLVLVDVATAGRRVIAGPISGRGFAPATGYTGSYSSAGFADDLVWSPDGARLALTVGRGFDVVSQSWANPNAVVPPRRYAVMLVDPGAGSSRVLTTTVGGPPTLEWSPDGSRLLVCAPSHGPSTGCGNHYVDSSAGGFPPPPSVLSVVHVDSGRSRVVARGRLQFSGWSPTGDGYAWADDLDLHVVRANGASRRHTIDVSGGSWLGWSPDGKHIAAGPNDSYELIDVATGKTSWPIPPSYSRYIIQSVRWWP